MSKSRLALLHEEIAACHRCPRLIEHCRRTSEVKRRAFQDWEYWGRPLPGWGDPRAKLLILGLAPAAHGGNRTGRPFTGDSSGDFLFRALHANGFASQAASLARGDGQQLIGAYMSNAVRCAPPDNKPTPGEFAACSSFLERELMLLRGLRVVVPLGKLAFNAYLSVLLERGQIASRAPFVFGHHRLYRPSPDGPALLASYHPSRQNTCTGRLTDAMLHAIFAEAKSLIAGHGR